jgi:hypothetical protein
MALLFLRQFGTAVPRPLQPLQPLSRQPGPPVFMQYPPQPMFQSAPLFQQAPVFSNLRLIMLSHMVRLGVCSSSHPRSLHCNNQVRWLKMPLPRTSARKKRMWPLLARRVTHSAYAFRSTTVSVHIRPLWRYGKCCWCLFCGAV